MQCVLRPDGVQAVTLDLLLAVVSSSNLKVLKCPLHYGWHS